MSGHRYRLSKAFGYDAAGAPLPSGKLVFSESGGATPLAVYSDAGLSSSAGTTVTADSAGLFGDIFLQLRPYRVELWNNALTTMIFREDPVYPSRVRTYEASLPSVNWKGLETVLTGTEVLNERDFDDAAWNDRGDTDTAINAATVTEALAGTSTTKVLTPDAGYGVWGKGDNLTPSGGTVTLDSDGGGVFNVAAGNFSAISSAVGGRAVLFIFGGTSVITHNGTSLILPGGADITTEAGDCALFVNEAARDATGTDWRCVWYQRDGTTLAAVPNYAASNAEQVTGSSLLRWVTPGNQNRHESAIKAWLNYAHDTNTVNDSYAVTSVDDDATGLFGVNMSITFGNTTYIVGGWARSTLTTTGFNVTGSSTVVKTTTAMDLGVRRTSTEAATDSPEVCVQFSGTLA